jgi:hypothetical protein
VGILFKLPVLNEEFPSAPPPAKKRANLAPSAWARPHGPQFSEN